MTEEQKATPNPETAVLNEVDNLLNELDPEFNSTLSKINSDVREMGDISGLESITLSADYLKEGGESKGEEVLAPPVVEVRKPEDITQGQSFLEILWEFSFASIFLPVPVISKTFALALTLKNNPPRSVLKNVPEVLAPTFHNWFVLFQALIQKLQTFSLPTYIKLGIIIILLFTIRLTLIDMKSRLSPDKTKDPFLRSWAGVADATYPLPLEGQGEDIDDPLRHLEYTVLIHKMVANLKPPNPHRSPMVNTELYIEASNQDAAIEIKDRELEVRDSLDRVFEETTFDELDTKGGKERLKVRIRSALNQMLNKGHVKRVFFSSLNMAP